MLLGMNQPDFEKLLSDEGYPVGPRQHKLPPSAHKFLIRMACQRNIDPLTGAISPSILPPPDASQNRDQYPLSPSSFGRIGRRRNLRWLMVDEVLGIHMLLSMTSHKRPTRLILRGRATTRLSSPQFFDHRQA